MANISLMEEAWKSARKNIFRLEAIPEYNIPEDLVSFKKWKQGKSDLDEASKKWLENLSKTGWRGVRMQRVRVVSLPLSEYIKYEIDFWKYSIKNGEEILFLEDKKYRTAIQNIDFELRDFWMFDDKVSIIFHYDETGDFVKEEPVADQRVIKKHLELKQKMLQLAIPMGEFLKTNITANN
ncbi:MAG: DUF6879 family protein [Nanoarchaeota archaeon]